MPVTPRVGSYRLAEQIGGWAVFADITLASIVRPEHYSFVTFAEGVDHHLSDLDVLALGFGASYGFALAAQSKDMGILVTGIDTNPVDTTPMALAFAACRAVLNSFAIPESKGPYFQREAKSFVFPG
ncbi:MAG: hypothetical protein O2856_09055 [Planctomycetota bacterium]|nr:hypothetical protein [Planctomycetota bacterium]